MTLMFIYYLRVHVMYPKRSREQAVMCSLFSLPVSLPFPQQNLSNSLCSSNLLYQIVLKLVMLLNVLWQRGMRILYYREFHFPNTYHILMHPFSECLLSTCSIQNASFPPLLSYSFCVSGSLSLLPIHSHGQPTALSSSWILLPRSLYPCFLMQETIKLCHSPAHLSLLYAFNMRMFTER